MAQGSSQGVRRAQKADGGLIRGENDGVLPRQMLEAGGSLVRELDLLQPRLTRRLALTLELGLLFIGAPLLMTYAVYGLRIPLFLVLQPILLAFVIYLLGDRTFRLGRELTRGCRWTEVTSIIAMFLIVGGALAAYVEQEMPYVFLGFPLGNTALWAMIMVLYPVMSVIPQELVYRTFFFHRYGPLFGDRRWLLIVVNGALFGFAHILFGNYVSIILTTILGFLLAYRYARTGSLWAVWFEHTLYGCLIFTIGLGRYFFTGISSVS